MPEDQNQVAHRVSLQVVVDQIEEDWAIIVVSDESDIQFDLPIKYLPPGVKAGDHLTLSFESDPASKEATRQRIAEMKKELTKNNDPNQKNFKL